MKKPFYFLSLVCCAATAFFLQLHARAVSTDEIQTSYTPNFSSSPDPQLFMDNLEVVLPTPSVLMTETDAIAYELNRRSKSLSAAQASQVAATLQAEANKLGYDPFLFVALIRIESNFNHLATSAVGAEGLMQLMPYTAAEQAEREGLEWPDKHSFDPILNTKLGARYLARLNKQFNGRLVLSLTAYNRGPSATRYIFRKNGHIPKDIRDFYATKVLEKYKELKLKYGYLSRG